MCEIFGWLGPETDPALPMLAGFFDEPFADKGIRIFRWTDGVNGLKLP